VTLSDLESTQQHEPSERLVLAQKRVVSILRTYCIATEQTLEQKVSDAGHPHF